MQRIAALALLPLAFAAPQISTPLTNGPSQGTVQIRNVTYGGTGCPQGTVGSSISADLTKMTLIFDSYVVSIGPGIPITDSRRNCQLNVDLLYPGGFQYAIFSADYRGWAKLDQGVTGAIKSIYYFSGQQEQCSTQTNLLGPWEDNYSKHDEAEESSIVWSPCGAEGMLNLNSQIFLRSTVPAATGLLTTDSIDTAFTQTLYVSWRQCNL